MAIVKLVSLHPCPTPIKPPTQYTWFTHPFSRSRLALSSHAPLNGTEKMRLIPSSCLLCLTPVLFPVPLEDGFSHYSLTVHGCRIAFLYWPLLESARPVKFLWKLEQVRQGPASERTGWVEPRGRGGFGASGVVVVIAVLIGLPPISDLD